MASIRNPAPTRRTGSAPRSSVSRPCVTKLPPKTRVAKPCRCHREPADFTRSPTLPARHPSSAKQPRVRDAVYSVVLLSCPDRRQRFFDREDGGGMLEFRSRSAAAERPRPGCRRGRIFDSRTGVPGNQIDLHRDGARRAETNSAASCKRSFTPPRSTYSKVTRSRGRSRLGSRASSPLRSLHLRVTGMIASRTISFAALRLMANLGRTGSSAKRRMPGTIPEVETVIRDSAKPASQPAGGPRP